MQSITLAGVVRIEALEIEAKQPSRRPIGVARTASVEEGDHVVGSVSGLRPGELGPRRSVSLWRGLGLSDHRGRSLSRDRCVESGPIAAPLLDDESPRRVVRRIGEALLVGGHPRVELPSLRRESLALDRPHHEAGSASSSRSTIGPNSSGYRACGLCSS